MRTRRFRARAALYSRPTALVQHRTPTAPRHAGSRGGDGESTQLLRQRLQLRRRQRRGCMSDAAARPQGPNLGQSRPNGASRSTGRCQRTSPGGKTHLHSAGRIAQCGATLAHSMRRMGTPRAYHTHGHGGCEAGRAAPEGFARFRGVHLHARCQLYCAVTHYPILLTVRLAHIS